jgi:hypothetical protein
VPVPPELEVADVGAAESVRVAVRPPEVASSDGEAAVVAASVADSVAVVAAVVLAGAVDEGVVAVAALLPGDPAAPVLAGRLADVRDELVVLEVAGRGCDGRDGGRIAGGLPAPNAHPSTVPAFGCVEAAPIVL